MDNVVTFNDGEIELKVSVDEETAWLSRHQLAVLFDRDIKTIGKHIANVFGEGELSKDAVVAKFATTATDGKKYQVEYYNLDVIISVGYRVKSQRGVAFRQWATKMLKAYISDGFAINREKITQKRLLNLEEDVAYIKSKIQNNQLEHKQGIFYDGQVFDAYAFVADLIKSAKTSIKLIDNYIDESVLTIFSKNPDVQVILYTKNISKQLKLDLKKYNAQYRPIELERFGASHDRFLIIDDSEIYHIGASLKDLGKKWFAFSKMRGESLGLLEKLV